MQITGNSTPRNCSSGPSFLLLISQQKRKDRRLSLSQKQQWIFTDRKTVAKIITVCRWHKCAGCLSTEMRESSSQTSYVLFRHIEGWRLWNKTECRHKLFSTWTVFPSPCMNTLWNTAHNQTLNVIVNNFILFNETPTSFLCAMHFPFFLQLYLSTYPSTVRTTFYKTSA